MIKASTLKIIKIKASTKAKKIATKKNVKTPPQSPQILQIKASTKATNIATKVKKNANGANNMLRKIKKKAGLINAKTVIQYVAINIIIE